MTVVIDGTQYLPIATVARQLQTTELKILMFLKQKSLSGEFIEGSWYVTTASIDRFDPHACQPKAAASCRTTCSSSGCGCR